MPDSLNGLKAALSDRYEIERELGHGGMAIVHLARDLKHDRQVAIKVVRPEITNWLGSARFVREIEIAARLQHPNILPLHDSGDADGLLFYVMPYAEGETLRHRLLREVQLPIDEALRIAGEVAEALNYAHSHDVVHRDIKPGNIMLSGGHAVVADFGVARAISAAEVEPLTQSGLAIGTPEYMSPEQGSDSAKVDGRSDIYSLGCVLYEMLAGEPPFTGRTAQAVIARQMHEEPRSLRVVRPTVPQGVEDVVARALAKVPADRFATAKEFAEALSGVPVGARRKRPRAKRSVLTRAFIGAVLVVAGLFGAMRIIPGGIDFQARDWVLIADFEGPADEPGLGRIVRELVVAGLNESPFVSTVPSDQLRRAKRDAGMGDSVTVDIDRARELAVRSSVRVILIGSVLRVGTDMFSVVIHAIDTEDGSNILSRTTTAQSEDELIDAVGRLVIGIREGLGERRGSLEATRPLINVATPSVEAYRRYVDGSGLAQEGKYAASNRALREAVRIDTAFASAWWLIASNYLSQRQPDSALAAFDNARRYPERLRDALSYRFKADVAYSMNYDLAASIEWYDLYLQEVPTALAGHNNRGLYLSSMGRHREAVSAFEQATAIDPFLKGPRQLELLNLAAELVVVGGVDSARALSDQLTGRFAQYMDMMLPNAAGNWDTAESRAREYALDAAAPNFIKTAANASLASSLAARGRVREADQYLERAALEAGGAVARWYQRARLFLSLVSRSPNPPLPASVASDTTAAGEILRGIWAAAVGDSLTARNVLADAARRDSITLRRLGSGPTFIEALIHATGGRPRKVIEELAPIALRGEHDALSLDRVSSLEMRWLVAQAYGELGLLDSATAYMKLVIRPTLIPPSNYSLRGVPHGFAIYHLGRWYDQRDYRGMASEYLNGFVESFASADERYMEMVAAVRERSGRQRQ